MNLHWWSNLSFHSRQYGSDRLRPRRIYNYSLFTYQPRPVIEEVLFHTSQLSLAIPSSVGAVSTTNGDSVVTAIVTTADKTKLFVQLVQRDQSQSQSTDDLVMNAVVGCQYFTPGLWLPSHSLNITTHYTSQ